MTTQHVPASFPAVQGATYGVALSLDSLLLNGISCGVFQQAVFPGFVEKVASNLLRDLASLEQQVPDASDAIQPKIKPLVAALRGKCQQLIGLVTGLRSFTALPLPQLRTTVSQIPPLRAECVKLIQELEADFGVPGPFYPSRPSHSAAAVDDFLGRLERAFMDAWAAANVGRQASGVSDSLASASRL